MSIAIERGVPLPVLRVGRPTKYPFKEMVVGDSFIITGTMSVLNVREAIRYYTKKTGRKFVVRKTDPFTNLSRCWRVS